MDGELIINSIFNGASRYSNEGRQDRRDMMEAMFRILDEESDFLIARDADALRTLALENTDLVEPTDE